jgi:hypothetical protein
MAGIAKVGSGQVFPICDLGKNALSLGLTISGDPDAAF